MPDPIDEFIALPNDQQMSTLQQLTPDNQDKLLDQVRQRRASSNQPPSPTGDWRDKYTAIQPHQPINSVSDLGREVARGVGNIGAGGLGAILRPVSTLESIGSSFAHPINTATDLATSLKDKPLETIESMIGQSGATAGLGAAGEAGLKLVPRPTGVAKALAGAGKNTARQLVEDVTNSNAKAEADAQTANAKAAEKHAGAVQDAVAKAQDQYQKDLAKNLTEKQKVQAKNQKAVSEFQSQSAQQAKIAPTQAKLDEATSNLRAGIETARNDALKVGNEKYSTVNSALDPYEADPEKIRTGLADATESIPGDKMPPLIKDLTDRLEHPTKSLDPLTYDELQSYYSKLGNQISKGTLDGETYHAYDVLHDAIGDEMQRIANEHGLGDKLQEARNYWRRMKQTFGKPYGATDAATATLKGINPDFLTMDTQANRLRLLGSFDSRIPGLAQHVQNLQTGMESLPKPTPARMLTQNLAESKQPVPAPPKAPDLSNLPGAPDRPATVEPQTNVVTPESLEQANRESIAAREKKARTGYSPWLTSISALEAIKDAVAGNWKAVGLDLGARGAYEAGKQGYAALLRNPTVVDFLSKPTAEQIAQIPPELRGPGLQPILDAAKKQGVKVDPRIYAIAGVTPPKKRVAAALTK
jgi:hypothetical protein